MTWALAVAGCTVTSDQPDLTGQDVHLTVIHTADIHSRIFPYLFAPGQIDKGQGLIPSQGANAIVGGAARMMTRIKQIRAASSRVIHIDSGDVFEGAPVFNYYGGEVEMRAMTRFGVAGAALGNHEFDKGATQLALMKEQWGGFPILAANYTFSDPTDPTQPKLARVIAPFTIVNAQGIKIGIVGMGNLSSLEGIYEGGNPLGIRPLETVSAIHDAVRLLRPQVDLLMIASHLGLDVDEGLAQANALTTCTACMADTDCSNEKCLNGVCTVAGAACIDGDQNVQSAIEGVDVIFGGHLHITLDPPNRITHRDGSYTIVCHSGAFAKFIGQLDLLVHVGDPNATAVEDRHSRVKSYTYKLHPITDAIVEDTDMARMLEPYLIRMQLDLRLGERFAVVPCPSAASTCPKVQRSDASGGDSQLGNLVATSMRLRPRVEADFGLTNSLGIRADFESGPLDVEEMYNVFPFDNTITAMFLSGNETKEMLDFLAARASDRGCRSQAQVSGIWYVNDCTHRISCGPFDAKKNIASSCHPSDALLAPDDPARLDGPILLGDDCRNHPEHCHVMLPFSSYRIAVNDYIANGGSGFAVLKRNTTKFNTGISLRDALIDYIRTLPERCDGTDYTNIVGPVDPMTMLPSYDYARLPCLAPEGVESHEDRIHMVAP